MATEGAIGALAAQAMAKLTAEMARLGTLAELTAPDMPTDRDPRLQAAKRLTVLAQFMATGQRCTGEAGETGSQKSR